MDRAPTYLERWIAEKRRAALCAVVVAGLSVAVVFLAFRLSHAPVYVVPGAREGVYYPSRYRTEVVKQVAERVAYLYMNYNPANVADVLKEAAKMFTPQLYAQAARDIQRRIDFAQKNQVSQVFFVDSVRVTQSKPSSGWYHVQVRGRYTVFVSGSAVKSGITSVFVDVVRCRPTVDTPLGFCVNGFYESESGS